MGIAFLNIQSKMNEELNGNSDQGPYGVEDQQDTQTFLTIAALNKNRVECEQTGNFMEAARLKEKINKLGEDFYRRKMSESRQKHQGQKDLLEGEFQKELTQCEEFWNNKIETYNEQSTNLEEELREKHERQLGDFEVELDQKIQKVGKLSPEVLNLEYQIARLVKDQRYTRRTLCREN